MCQWAVKLSETVIRCVALCEDSGCARIVHPKVCIGCGGDRTGIVYKNLYLSGLRARLIAGSLRRYQKRDPVDLPSLFHRFQQSAGDEAARNLLKEMFYYQIAVSESQGGLPAAEVAATIEALAKSNGMESVIEEIAREQDAEPARDSAANPL